MKISVEITDFRDSDGEPCEVEVYFDREGLNYILRELGKLKDVGDHVHFMTPSWGMDDLSEDKVINKNNLAHHLKLTIV